MSDQKRRLVREYYENVDGSSGGRRLVREYYEDIDDEQSRGWDVGDGEFYDDDDDEEAASYTATRRTNASARQTDDDDLDDTDDEDVGERSRKSGRLGRVKGDPDGAAYDAEDIADRDDPGDDEEDTGRKRRKAGKGKRRAKREKTKRGGCVKFLIIAVIIIVIALVLLFACSASDSGSSTDSGSSAPSSTAAGLPDDEYTAIVDAWNDASYKFYRNDYSANSYITNDPDDPGEAERGEPTNDEELPSSFDLRDYGYVTPVKSQSPWGTCWAFAETAAAETSILSELGQTYEETGLDLSELQLAWFAYDIAPDAAGGAAGEGIYYYNDDTVPNIRLDVGGSISQAIPLFSSGVGPASEDLIPYKNAEDSVSAWVWEASDPDNYYAASMTEEDLERLEADGYEVQRRSYAKTVTSYDDLMNDAENAEETDATWAVDDSLWGVSEYALQNGCQLPEFHVLDSDKNYVRTDEEAIKAAKRELLAGHGIAIGILADISTPGSEADTTYYDTENNALYVTTVESTDHAVLIVGYDDNYPKENFGNGDASMQPPADGAWIIKNSWGAGTEEFPNHGSYGIVNEDGLSTGYFYLSYYDQSYNEPTTYDFDLDAPSADDTYIYQYTYCVPSNAPTILTSQSKSHQANVYTAEQDTTLYAVSAETTHVNTELTIDVYLLDDDAQNPTDGTLAVSVQETYEFAGYHRMALDEADYVDLPAGQRFSLVVTQYCPDNGLYYQSVDRAYNSNADSEADADAYTETIVEQYYNEAYNAYVERYEAEGMTEEEAQAKAEADAIEYIDTDEITNEIIDLVKQYVDPEKSMITMLNVGEKQSYVYNEGDDGNGVWVDWSIISGRLEALSTDVHEVYDNFAIKGYALTR